MNNIQIRKVALGGYHRGDVEQLLRQVQRDTEHQQSALQAAQAERDSLTSERDTLQQETVSLHAALAEKTQESAALQTALDRSIQEKDELTDVLQEVQRSCDRLADELRAQQAALEEQRHLFDELLQEYGKLENKLARCNQVGRLAREGGDKAAQALTGVAARLQELRSQVQEVDAALDLDGLDSSQSGT